MGISVLEKTMEFKDKKCLFCGKIFTPIAGPQIYCNYCKTHCYICGKEKSGISGSIRMCKLCVIKNRQYKDATCIICGKTFKSTNGIAKKCSVCNPRIPFCLDCKKPITKGRLRCNSCERKYGHKIGRYKEKGWKKYKFNGINYRSSWEVEAAKIFFACGVKFEYEKYDKETKTTPDFFLPQLNRYFEIHPDAYGIKRLPKNSVIAKTRTQAVIFAIVQSFRVNENKTKRYIKSMSKNKKKYFLKSIIYSMFYVLALKYNSNNQTIEEIPLFSGNEKRQKVKELYNKILSDKGIL